jgi:ribosomal protein L37AE/L43A
MLPWRTNVQIVDCDPRVVDLVIEYVARLELPHEHLSITTSRTVFSDWIGRTMPFRIGGAYAMHPVTRQHLILVHLERLNLDKPWAIEVVVAEELIHMRDHLRGDYRRHSHHGHDRIAVEVARITGFTPEQQRDIFGERTVLPYRHFYQCPKCHTIIIRKRRGRWGCRACQGRYRKQFLFVEVAAASVPQEARDRMKVLNQEAT